MLSQTVLAQGSGGFRAAVFTAPQYAHPLPQHPQSPLHHQGALVHTGTPLNLSLQHQTFRDKGRPPCPFFILDSFLGRGWSLGWKKLSC